MQRRARKSLLRLRRDARTLGPDNLEILERASVELGMPQTAATFAKARQSRFPSDASAVDRLSAQFPKPYVALLAKRAKKERLDVEIPVAVVYQESRFNPRAVSPVGALGLMQLMPATARSLFKEEKRRKSPTTADILDPANNTRLGVRYLARMLRAFDRRTEYALAAYNAGPGAVTRWRQARGDLPVEIFVEEIPYRETRQYVRKVLAGLQTFRFVQRAREPTSREATAELASAEPPTAR